ncbi:MAG: hypothetical protein R3B84_01770 [Zavarzinella sp.]
MIRIENDIFLPNGYCNPDCFSAATWQVLQKAVHAAETHQWEMVRTCHLLMALLQSKDHLATKLLQDNGLQAADVLYRLDQQFPPKDSRVTCERIHLHREYLSQQVLDLLRAARFRQMDMGRTKVSTGDLWWCLLERPGYVTAVLSTQNTKIQQLKAQILTWECELVS